MLLLSLCLKDSTSHVSVKRHFQEFHSHWPGKKPYSMDYSDVSDL